MTKRIAILALFGALILSPGFALAGAGDHSLEQLAIEMADTPEQHAALAEHYRAKAEEARQEVERHERMARTFSGGAGKVTAAKMQKRQQMSRHCKQISDKYAGIADDYEALAKLQEEAAKSVE